MNCDINESCSSADDTDGCECGKSECGCGSGESGCGSGQKDCDSGLKGCGSGQQGCGSASGHAAMIFQVALEAKHELLVEKIKAKLEKTHGKKLDKVADLVAKVLAAKWKGKREMAEAWLEFEEGLKKLWSEK